MIIDEENNNIFIVEKLNSLKNELNRDQVNLKSVQRDIKQLENYDNTANYEYLNSLLDPIRQKGVKIPGKCPVPSCTFQLHNYLTFKPGDNGNDVFTFNPFFLSSDKFMNKSFTYGNAWYDMIIGCGTYFFANTVNEVTGNNPAPDWYYPSAVLQNIPDVYSKYRLVSACCTVKYLGSIDEAKGVVGCGISYLKSPYVGVRFKLKNSEYVGSGTRNPLLSNYGDFELIRDSYYHSENMCLEGLKMLYFPLDNSFEEFKNVWDGTIEEIIAVDAGGAGTQPCVKIPEKFLKTGFNWFVYLQGCPTSETRNFRFDIYLNYECIPKAEFLNYMPISLNVKPCLSDGLKKKFMEEVQDKAIQKINIY